MRAGDLRGHGAASFLVERRERRVGLLDEMLGRFSAALPTDWGQVYLGASFSIRSLIG